MGPEARTDVVQCLEDSQAEFLEAVSGVTEAQAKAHPQAGRWSVLECVEHVVTVEERFFGRLEKAPREGAPPVDKEHEGELHARVKNRGARAEAPEPVRPIGRFTSLAQATEAFQTARARTIRFADQQGAALYSRAESHPRFGPLNGTEMLLIIAGHAQRHAAQIRELRSELTK